MSLFRKESLERRDQRLHGDVIVHTSVKALGLLALICALVLLFILILYFTEYSRRQPAKGIIVPDKGLISLSADVSGTLSKVFIEQGEDVTKNQALIHIDTSRFSGSNRQNEKRLLDQLEKQSSAHFRRIDILNDTYRLKKATLKQNLDSIKNYSAGLAQTIKLLEERVSMETVIFDRYNEIYEDEIVSLLELTGQKRTMLRGKEELQSLQNQLAVNDAEISKIELEIASNDVELKERLEEQNLILLDIETRRIELEASSTTEIRAPLEGFVSAVFVNEGQQVETGSELLALVPSDSKLIAEVLVPSRSIGYVQVGQDVIIELNDFPSEKFGRVIGTVYAASESTIPERWQNDQNQGSYIVKITLNKDFVELNGKQFNLSPGMEVTCEIVSEKLPLWKWLVLSLRGDA